MSKDEKNTYRIYHWICDVCLLKMNKSPQAIVCRLLLWVDFRSSSVGTWWQQWSRLSPNLHTCGGVVENRLPVPQLDRLKIYTHRPRDSTASRWLMPGLARCKDALRLGGRADGRTGGRPSVLQIISSGLMWGLARRARRVQVSDSESGRRSRGRSRRVGRSMAPGAAPALTVTSDPLRQRSAGGGIRSCN